MILQAHASSCECQAVLQAARLPGSLTLCNCYSVRVLHDLGVDALQIYASNAIFPTFYSFLVIQYLLNFRKNYVCTTR